jgi:hypothetical protein
LRGRDDVLLSPHAAGVTWEAYHNLSNQLIEKLDGVLSRQPARDIVNGVRNFFASVAGTRKGPRIGPPRLRFRKDNRQTIRFTNDRGAHTHSFVIPLLIAGGVALTGAAVYAFLLPPVRRLRLG